MARSKGPNEAEQAFPKSLQAEGWEVIRDGFPDFLCRKGHELIFVEVKATVYQPLSPPQLKVCDILTAYGIQCMRWSPDKQELKPFHHIEKRGGPFLSTSEMAHFLGISKSTLLRRIERSVYPPPIGFTEQGERLFSGIWLEKAQRWIQKIKGPQ